MIVLFLTGSTFLGLLTKLGRCLWNSDSVCFVNDVTFYTIMLYISQ